MVKNHHIFGALADKIAQKRENLDMGNQVAHNNTSYQSPLYQLTGNSIYVKEVPTDYILQFAEIKEKYGLSSGTIPHLNAEWSRYVDFFKLKPLLEKVRQHVDYTLYLAKCMRLLHKKLQNQCGKLIA